MVEVVNSRAQPGGQRKNPKTHHFSRHDSPGEAPTSVLIDEGLLSVDALKTAPAQGRASTPYTLIRAAVLSQAIKDLSSGGAEGRTALLWIEGKSPSAPGFSLAEICDALGFDSCSVKESLIS